MSVFGRPSTKGARTSTLTEGADLATRLAECVLGRKCHRLTMELILMPKTFNCTEEELPHSTARIFLTFKPARGEDDDDVDPDDTKDRFENPLDHVAFHLSYILLDESRQIPLTPEALKCVCQDPAVARELTIDQRPKNVRATLAGITKFLVLDRAACYALVQKAGDTNVLCRSFVVSDFLRAQ